MENELFWSLVDDLQALFLGFILCFETFFCVQMSFVRKFLDESIESFASFVLLDYFDEYFNVWEMNYFIMINQTALLKEWEKSD